MNNKYDDFLELERENIQKATIEANENIDEKKAKEVNNKIKVHKKNIFVKILIIIICLIVALFLTYYGVNIIKENLKEENTTTTTTQNRIKLYVDNVNKIRKFKNNNNIIYLLPMSFESKTININIRDMELITYDFGTYNIKSDSIDIKTDEEINSYQINSNGLNNDYIIDESEFKYYVSNDEIILIDAYINKCFIINETIEVKEYIEYDDKIIIDSLEYIKENENIINNGKVYNYLT